jgi:4-hydroxy-tetrahydrodipicolinate reductase
VPAVPILIYGATGRMGAAIRECLPEEPGVSVRACVAPDAESSAGPGDASWGGEPAWLTPDRLADPAARAALPEDLVVIDVSLVDGTVRLAEILGGWPRALVAATTGLDAATEARLESLARSMPVLRARNLSLGVAVLERVLRSLPAAARAAFEADIVEHHHAGKRDAPSGTALELSKAIGSAGAGARPGGEVRVASIRAGTVPGTHRVLLSGAGETLELTHTVYDRRVFARGALRAARFLHGRPPGLYTAAQLLEQS